MICSNGQCRNPQCVDQSSCSCRTDYTGFVIEKYNDQDGNASRGSTEPGLSWNFKWDLNHDENWRDYVTYDTQNGRGGTIGNLHDGDVVRVREQSKDGWHSTTNTELTLTMHQNQIQVAVFGNKSNTPELPKILPKTGADLQAGLSLALTLGAGGWSLYRLGKRRPQL
jgi:hypothetical protein